MSSWKLVIDLLSTQRFHSKIRLESKNNFQEDKTLVTSFPQDTEVGKTRGDNDANQVKNITKKDVSQILQTSPEALTKTETFGNSSNPDDMPTVSESVPPVTASNNKVLDLNALNENLESKVTHTPPKNSGKNKVPSHTGAGYEVDHQTSKSNISQIRRERRSGPRRGPSARKQQKKTSGVISFFVSVMSVIVIGVVAQSFFPKQVRQVGEFFEQLQVNTVVITAPRQIENPSVEPAPLPLPPAPNPNPTRGLIVQSNPSGG